MQICTLQKILILVAFAVILPKFSDFCLFFVLHLFRCIQCHTYMEVLEQGIGVGIDQQGWRLEVVEEEVHSRVGGNSGTW